MTFGNPLYNNIRVGIKDNVCNLQMTEDLFDNCEGMADIPADIHIIVFCQKKLFSNQWTISVLDKL